MLQIVVFAGITFFISRRLGNAQVRALSIVAGVGFVILGAMVVLDAGSRPGATRTTGFITMLLIFGTVAVSAAIDYVRRPSRLS